MNRNTYFIKGESIVYDATSQSVSHSHEFFDFNEIPSASYVLAKTNQTLLIPVSIFSGSLAPLQALVLFLKEKRGLENSEISHLVGRDTKTIWITYKSCRNKSSSLTIDLSSVQVPVTIFTSDNLSILESLVDYLKNQGRSYADIARLIKRDQRTVWTCQHRAQRKMKGVAI